jgi:hypothetical protein
MNAVPTRDELFEMAARPIAPVDDTYNAKVEAGKRAGNLWLPAGKMNPSATREGKALRAEMRALQIDLEDAVEAAGGARGHVGQ